MKSTLQTPQRQRTFDERVPPVDDESRGPPLVLGRSTPFSLPPIPHCPPPPIPHCPLPPIPHCPPPPVPHCPPPPVPHCPPPPEKDCSAAKKKHIDRAPGVENDVGRPIPLMGTTVEDILFWLMINMSQKLDREILKRARRLDASQDRLRTISGRDPEARAARKELQSSVDLEATQLKRLSNLRRRMARMLQEVLNKYHRSAMKAAQG